MDFARSLTKRLFYLDVHELEILLCSATTRLCMEQIHNKQICQLTSILLSSIVTGSFRFLIGWLPTVADMMRVLIVRLYLSSPSLKAARESDWKRLPTLKTEKPTRTPPFSSPDKRVPRNCNLTGNWVHLIHTENKLKQTNNSMEWVD